MKIKRLHSRNLQALLALLTLLCLGAVARAQSSPAQDDRRVQDNDTLRADRVQFDQFLDSHREISEQLRKDPSLVNRREFVENHPALQTYLQNNPSVREQLRRDPSAFMRPENNFDRGDFNRRDDDVRDRDITRRDLAEFDRFLDGHREIAEQIRKNPSLVDNREFVQNHPALQAFLQNNPGVRDQLRQDPNAFMRDENRFDRAEDRRDRDFTRTDRQADRQADREQFDRFLDSHREIAEQVRKNPSLVENREFVQNHPALQSYLQNNPGVRDQVRQDPDAFTRPANDFDRRDDARVRDEGHERMASFGEFMKGHSAIANDVSRNPSVVRNQEYVENHRELNDYLNAHPEVKKDWAANPQGFVKGAQQSSSGDTTGAPNNGRGVSTNPSGHTSTNGSNSTGSPTGTSNPAPTQEHKPKQ